MDIESIGTRLDAIPRTETHRTLIDELVRDVGAFPVGDIFPTADVLRQPNLFENEDRFRELEPLGFSLQRVFTLLRSAAWRQLGDVVDFSPGNSPRLSPDGLLRWNAMSPDLRGELAAAGLQLHFGGIPAAAPEGALHEDLLVLSRDMDGRSPFLVGTISRLHIALCALAIGETFEESKARVLRWAAALGLTIEPDALQE
jgi:hypothetical protein